MSSISMDVPTFQINENEIQNMVSFVYKHERILKEFGAIKIQPNIHCKLALKKRPKNLMLNPITRQIIKMNPDDLIYSVQEISHIDEFNEQTSAVKDEVTFWSELSYLNHDQRQLNISFSLNDTFFCQRKAKLYFDIYRVPNQSLLKMGGKKITSECFPCVKRAHRAGAIFPLSCSEQHLFSIDYHHEGGRHHWYIIPSCERETLQRIINRENLSVCLDHGQIVIDPSFLNKHHIRYHRIIQCPNEFVVLSASTLAQSFTEDASWSESIVFALPSWIEEGHASHSRLSCQCDIFNHSLSETIDITIFNYELIQKYIRSSLNNTTNDKPIVSKGRNYPNMIATVILDKIPSNLFNDETIMSTSMELMSPVEETIPSCKSTSSLFITPSISSYLCEDDKDQFDSNSTQAQYKVLEMNVVCDNSTHGDAIIC